jgi:hypothetical protein
MPLVKSALQFFRLKLCFALRFHFDSITPANLARFEKLDHVRQIYMQQKLHTSLISRNVTQIFSMEYIDEISGFDVKYNNGRLVTFCAVQSCKY